MENSRNRDSTLSEVTANFLQSLPSQDREKAQTEVYKFIRWFGLHRKVSELSALDVASYAEQITSPAAEWVKSFLTYIRRKGFIKANLASYLRVKRASKAGALSGKVSQAQTALTAQGYAKLEAELAALKSQRPHIAEELHKAAADKDFRENAPLEAARGHQAYLEGRIQELESTLRQARVMDEDQYSPKIQIGDTVVLRDLSSGKELCYVLVDPREANPIKGKISIASPLGGALLGKEKGQWVEVTAPAGTFSYHIEDIR